MEEFPKELNNFLCGNAVKNLNIPYYENRDSLAENIDGPTINTTAKSRNHPCILAIASEYIQIEKTFLSILFLKKTFLQK